MRSLLLFFLCFTSVNGPTSPAAANIPTSPVAPNIPTADPDVAGKQSKAAKIIVPRAVFTDATVKEAMHFLEWLSRKYEPDPEGVRVEFIGPAIAKERRMSFDVKKTSLARVARMIADAANLEVRCIGDKIIFSAK